jgi:hypothetical protein
MFILLAHHPTPLNVPLEWPYVLGAGRVDVR